MPDHVDVLVVGAGPAGAAAAIEARASGLDVLVVDKATFPRDKTCGDGLTASALHMLEHFGVEVPVLPGFESVRETVLVSPSGRQVVLPLPNDGAHSAVVPREELDAALVRRVRELGVEVREGIALSAVREHATGLDLELSDADASTVVHARFVVAADGHWSPTRRMLGGESSDPDLGTWHAVRQYFTGVHERRQLVLFERDLLPGYAWVFPLAGGRANVGFGVLRDQGRSGKELAALWRDVLERPAMRTALGADAHPEGPHRAWPIPASFDAARATIGRVLFAGDAAGVVDPMTGEGIGQALESGTLAARAVASADDPVIVSERYRRALQRALGRDLRFAAHLQRVLRSPLGARLAIRAAGLTPWTRRNFARWMFEDYPRALVLTPDRWHRGVFTPVGAYRAA